MESTTSTSHSSNSSALAGSLSRVSSIPAWISPIVAAETSALTIIGVGIIGAFAALYGVARITSEFFREPDPQLGFLWGGLTMGMILSVPMIVAGLAFIAAAWRRGPRTAGDGAAKAA